MRKLNRARAGVNENPAAVASRPPGDESHRPDSRAWWAVGGKTRRAGVRDVVLAKWARMVLITAGSAMLAMTLTTPPQPAQVSMSTFNTRTLCVRR